MKSNVSVTFSSMQIDDTMKYQSPSFFFWRPRPKSGEFKTSLDLKKIPDPCFFEHPKKIVYDVYVLKESEWIMFSEANFFIWRLQIQTVLKCNQQKVNQLLPSNPVSEEGVLKEWNQQSSRQICQCDNVTYLLLQKTWNI